MAAAEEFLLKQNTYKKQVVLSPCRVTEIKVSRTRTSDGKCAIFLKVGTEKRIEISNEPGGYGDNYYIVAQTIANLLQQAVDDACTLPKTT